MRAHTIAPAITNVALILSLVSCGDSGFYGNAGDFGATQGGVQDMSFARDLIANGQVPPPEAFVVEGMFSEHELGLEGAACQTLLCLRSAVGVAPTLGGEPSGWMQVGMSSTIDPETFERPSLTLIATVDVSSSMGWDYTDDPDYPSAGGLAKMLLERLALRLDSGDRIAIVTYGSGVDTLLPLTPGDNRAAVDDAVASLTTSGSTNMEAGLERAYQIATAAAGETDETRVILFTDVQPNVGATDGTEFERMAAAGADSGVGLTVLGLGLGMGQQVLLAMSHLRGGNAFSFGTPDQVEVFMEDDWPWFVSPIAYDMSLHVASSANMSLADAYGFPADAEGEVGLDVATVFLSRRKGALLVRLGDVDGAEQIAPFDTVANLSYTDRQGNPVTEELAAQYGGEPLDERGQYFAQSSVAKSTALAILVSGMHEASELYQSDHTAAVEYMTAVHQRFSADAEGLADPALVPEVDLAAALLALMQADAPQGDFYPY